MADKPRGRFAWHELMTPDPAAATSFYPTVVQGWRAQSSPMGGMDYTLWLNGEVPVGGMMELDAQLRQAGVPPHWLVYISTPDVEATVERARSLGATLLVGPGRAEGVGRWAILDDPQRAGFAVFQAENPSGAPLTPPQAGEFSWHELATTNIDAAFGFYSELFGWSIAEDHDMGPMGIYRVFEIEGQQSGGMYNKPPEMPAPPHWLPYVRVESADAAAERLQGAGGQVLHGPIDVPGGGRIVMAVDPQGAHFAVDAAGAQA